MSTERPGSDTKKKVTPSYPHPERVAWSKPHEYKPFHIRTLLRVSSRTFSLASRIPPLHLPPHPLDWLGPLLRRTPSLGAVAALARSAFVVGDRAWSHAGRRDIRDSKSSLNPAITCWTQNSGTVEKANCATEGWYSPCRSVGDAEE